MGKVSLGQVRRGQPSRCLPYHDDPPARKQVLARFLGPFVQAFSANALQTPPRPFIMIELSPVFSFRGVRRMASRVAFLVAALLLAAVPVRANTSNSLLDVSPDGSRLLVANSDNGTVTVVDTAKRTKLHEIKVGDKPEGVAWIGGGPLAVVTVYREGTLVFLDADGGKVVHKLKVPAEPYGVVTNKEGTLAYVTHEYPGTVTEIDLKERKVLREMKAGSMVRGIALAPDEKRVYVTEFYSAALHALDLKEGKVVDS